jgi:hypothetical protein
MDTLRFAHLRADTLERYSLGQLTDASAKRAEEHFVVCGACRERLDDFESFLSLIRAAHAPMTMSCGSPAA